jgi:hypothetical protein
MEVLEHVLGVQDPLWEDYQEGLHEIRFCFEPMKKKVPEEQQEIHLAEAVVGMLLEIQEHSLLLHHYHDQWCCWPRGDSIRLVDQGMAHTDQVMAQAEQVIAQAEHVVTQAEHVVAQAEHMVPQAEQAVPQAEQAVPQAEQVGGLM